MEMIEMESVLIYGALFRISKSQIDQLRDLNKYSNCLYRKIEPKSIWDEIFLKKKKD